jgi:hypothetical protein
MFRERDPRKTPSFDWVLWVKWILATTLGWVAGWAISEFAVGLVVGLAQWVALRKQIECSEWWVLASGIGWAAGRGLVVAVFPPQSTILIGGTLGAALGLAQWLILRRHVVQAWWWIVVSALSWAVGLTGFLGASLVGTVAGAVTGLALEPMLRYSTPPPDEQKETA